MFRHLLYGAVLASTTAVAAAGGPAQPPPSIAPATLSFGPFDASGDHAGIALADSHLRVHFGPGSDWPFVVLRARDGALDWSEATTLDLPVQNRGDEAIDLFVRIGDDDGATWPGHAISTHALIEPHREGHFLVVFQASDLNVPGMQSAPPPYGSPEGVLWVPRVEGHLERHAIRSLYFVISGQSGERELSIGTPRTLALDWRASATTALIDRFGQWRTREWHGKVHDEVELRSLHAEATSGRAQANPVSLDRYGGFQGGVSYPATGFFRVVRDHDSRWWFVTPEGHPFFSLGVNTVQLAAGRTSVEGRDNLFVALPRVDSGDPLAHFYGGRVGARWYDFYAANLWRIYGDEFATAFVDEALSRLPAWGFNTLGSWSDSSLTSAHRLPYVATLSLAGNIARISRPGSAEPGPPDPFDPGFVAEAQRQFRESTATSQPDPWLIGYFVENEIRWGETNSPDPGERLAPASWVLDMPATSPAKRELVGLLRNRYRSIEILNAAWDSNFAGWAALLDSRHAFAGLDPTKIGPDLAHFSNIFASAYYHQTAYSLRAVDSNHLYLGSRLAARNEAALDACARFCDVVSANLYGRSLAERLAERGGWPDRPILISEFSFVAPDRGLFGAGPVMVADSLERSRAYATYLDDALADPRVVGAHWFSYLDEPASGRIPDGENANFGIISITDVPDRDLVPAMIDANLRFRYALKLLTSH